MVYLIIQSTEIRMCTLSLMYHQLYGVAAAAAMVGIMKETDKICDWMSKNNKPFDPFDMDLDNDFELGRQVRFRTLHLMISILEKSPFSVPAAAGHKVVKEKSFSGNVPSNDENNITRAEAANTTGDNLQDQEKITVADINVLEKICGWDRLLPFKGSIAWSDYCNYLQQYYKRNASFVAELTSSLVASAEVCIKKEEELVSLWKARVVHFPDEILPVNTIIRSNLERAHSIICAAGGKHSVASTVAFACITKEADLMCELLKHGAGPTDDIIQQSSVIRMCALSLVHLQGFHAFDAAATMVGITKECKLMCDWIRKEDKLITFGIFPRHELLECRLIRIRTLDVMLTY
ncbi:hypothetical protein SETIT_6G177200v2 [Setaria italica]|nr:hypothetical protein SETIT_6G177200v2 [Setaria italica]